jgi:hypothetical protein
MIGRIKAGSGFKGVLQYIFGPGTKQDPHRATLIDTNLAGATPEQMAQEMAKLKDLRRTISKPVKHISISFKEGENPTNETIQKISQHYIEQMGFGQCQFVAVKHTDSNCSHFHLVLNRIGTDGSLASDKNERFRSVDVLKNLSKQFGLAMVDLKKNQPNVEVSGKTKNYQKYKNKEKVIMNDSNRFSMTGITKNKPAPFEWSNVDREKASRLKYPLSTIFKLLYLHYNHNFLDDLEFYQLQRVDRDKNRTILVTKTNDRIADNGDSITLESGPASPENIALMCKLAKSKGWEAVQFSGKDDFLLESWKQAHKLGLKISLKPGQEDLYKKHFKPELPEPSLAPADNLEMLPAKQPGPQEPIEAPAPRKLKL